LQHRVKNFRMSNRGFIVAEFSDGIQVIPKIWLQSEDLCKYPLHYKTDARIRKAIEKEETPNFDWPSFKINRTFGEYSLLQKADEKAEKAMYTSDMDTEKETKYYRKFRARKVLSSSGSEEESCSSVVLPSAPRPPVKRQRQYNTNERGNSSIMSAKRYNESQKVSNSSSHSFLQDANNYNILYERDEEAHNTAIYTKEENGQNILNRYVDEMEEIGRLSCSQENRQREKKNENLNYQPSQDPIVNHLKRLTREITTIKYDMRQTLTLLDILVKRTNERTEARNTTFSFEGAENRFPLQTAAQLAEIEEILKHRDSQHNAAIRAYIKSIGGRNVDDAVKRILYKTFSNKLAEKYNWEGRRGKEPLHKLELMKVIFRSILYNIPDSDQGKIQRRIMEWFRHSKARHQNEEKRKTHISHTDQKSLMDVHNP